MIYLNNGRVYDGISFPNKSVLVLGNKIAGLSTLSAATVKELNIETLDCSGCYVIPGLIDPHLHLIGGSGEQGGFSSQSLNILLSECVEGGVTTVVGTIGVDTTTKTMSNLVGKAKAFNEMGLNAFCYTGGYDCPPKTITDSVRNDLIYIQEIIGVGEIAIADHRSPEPELKDFARASIDAYVGGMLSGKAGITHVHVGNGKRKLSLIRELMEKHTVSTGNFHITHIGRNEELLHDAIDMANKGCFVDLDLWDEDFLFWYNAYIKAGGPRSQLTVSSDGGKGKPSELWNEIKNCVLNHGFSLEQMLPHFTFNTAQALKMSKKGRLSEGCDADIAVFDQKTFEMKHVISRGQILLKNGEFNFLNRPEKSRRSFDLYGIRNI
ncbi:MAG: amidohydrolase family protein [Bdellovibrio sp.]